MVQLILILAASVYPFAANIIPTATAQVPQAGASAKMDTQSEVTSEPQKEIICRYNFGYSDFPLDCSHYETFKKANFSVEKKRAKIGPDSLSGEFETIERHHSVSPEWNNPANLAPVLPNFPCTEGSCFTENCYIKSVYGKRRFDCQDVQIFQNYKLEIQHYRFHGYKSKVEIVSNIVTGARWYAPVQVGLHPQAVRHCESKGRKLPECSGLRKAWLEQLAQIFSTENIGSKEVWCTSQVYFSEWNRTYEVPARFHLVDGSIDADGSPLGLLGVICTK